MSKVKVAVIGLGLMGARHAELAAASERCDLVGVCDVDPALRRVADAFGAPFFLDVGDMLDATRPHGAIIATPSANHLRTFEQCAHRGVHALIEKPIADTVDAAMRIAEAAEAAGARVLVGHHRRHNPLARAAHQAIAEGRIGDILAVSMLWAVMKPADYFAKTWRSRRPDGGPVLINLVHEIDLLRRLCGEIDQVFAHARSTARGFEVEDGVSIAIALRSGAVATIVGVDAAASPWSYETTSGENPLYWNTRENCYFFIGSRGSLGFPSMDIWTYEDERRPGWDSPMRRETLRVQRADSLAEQLEHFCDVVQGKAQSLVDALDGARSLAAALAVLESAAANEPRRPAP